MSVILNQEAVIFSQDTYLLALSLFVETIWAMETFSTLQSVKCRSTIFNTLCRRSPSGARSLWSLLMLSTINMEMSCEIGLG